MDPCFIFVCDLVRLCKADWLAYRPEQRSLAAVRSCRKVIIPCVWLIKFYRVEQDNRKAIIERSTSELLVPNYLRNVNRNLRLSRGSARSLIKEY